MRKGANCTIALPYLPPQQGSRAFDAEYAEGKTEGAENEMTVSEPSRIRRGRERMVRIQPIP